MTTIWLRKLALVEQLKVDQKISYIIKIYNKYTRKSREKLEQIIKIFKLKRNHKY